MNEKFCKRNDTLIEEYNCLKERHIDIPSSTFNPSSLTECPRKIIYHVRGEKKDLAKETKLHIIRKNNFKSKWIDIFSRLKSVKVLYKNTIASDCIYNLYGIADVIINIDGKIHVVKFYKVTNDIFKGIKTKGALKKHIVGISGYVWMLEVNSGILVYESEKGEVEILNVFVKKYIVNSIMKKCKQLLDFKMKGVIPDRPYETKGNECIKCEYCIKCWQQ